MRVLFCDLCIGVYGLGLSKSCRFGIGNNGPHVGLQAATPSSRVVGEASRFSAYKLNFSRIIRNSNFLNSKTSKPVKS